MLQMARTQEDCSHRQNRASHRRMRATAATDDITRELLTGFRILPKTRGTPRAATAPISGEEVFFQRLFNARATARYGHKPASSPLWSLRVSFGVQSEPLPGDRHLACRCPPGSTRIS